MGKGTGNTGMKISRETDYAIRCVFYLAGKQGSAVMINEIAAEMSVPKSFLAKILQKLARAGVVKSYRGIKGGFEIAKPPGKINLLEVIQSVEPVAMNICALDTKQCSFSKTCSVHPVWLEVRETVEKMLQKKTFAKLKAL
jgi:Rrf2 family protein